MGKFNMTRRTSRRWRQYLPLRSAWQESREKP